MPLQWPQVLLQVLHVLKKQYDNMICIYIYMYIYIYTYIEISTFVRFLDRLEGQPFGKSLAGKLMGCFVGG